MAENVLSAWLSAIATAIRSKTGGTESMTPSEFVEKIEAIEISDPVEEYDGTITIHEIDPAGGGQD